MVADLVTDPVTGQAAPELERVMGIEPTLEAWEAAVLPLNYTRVTIQVARIIAGACLGTH